MLVTSREPLGVPGEAVWRVPPLADDDAVSLFVERASLVRPGFELDAAERGGRSARSRVHLDGIPLALELAAAWLRTLSPQQIEAGLDDRFTLLVRGPRGAQRRQQTLAGSIDWSHALLDGTDRGGASAGSRCSPARSVSTRPGRSAPAEPSAVDEVLPAIGRLVDKSLVVAEEHGGEARYRMLETIRAYAAARLAEAREEHGRCATGISPGPCEFAETTDARRTRGDPDGWRRALRWSTPNLRAALDRGLAGRRSGAGRRLAASLAWLWHLDRRGREGIDLPPPRDRPHAGRSVAAPGGPADRAWRSSRTPPTRSTSSTTPRPAALELATEVGDESLRALCLNLAAVGAFYTDFDKAWELCERGLRGRRSRRERLRPRAARARSRRSSSTCATGTPRPRPSSTRRVRRHLQLHRGVLSTVLGFQAQGALADRASRSVPSSSPRKRCASPNRSATTSASARPDRCWPRSWR